MLSKVFKKHCVICGEEVSKEKVIVRFGKRVCSEEHAEEYRKKLAREESKSAGGGGCC